MAVRIIGFETGAGNEHAGSAISGTSSVQSTVKKSGTYALRCNPTTTATGSMDTVGALTIFPTLTAAQSVRFAFRVDTAPASLSEEFFAFGTTQILRLDSARKILIYNSSTLVTGPGPTALTLGQWYDILVVRNGATMTVYLDGVQEITTSGGGTGNATPRFGKVTNRNGQSVDYYFDDISISDSGTETLSSLPAGKVIARQGEAGAVSGGDAYTKSTGTTAYNLWSDTPVDAATNCSSATSGAAQTMQVAAFSSGTDAVPAGATLNWAQIVLHSGTSATSSSGNLHSVRRRISAANTDQSADNLQTTANFRSAAAFTPDTLANMDAMEAGQVHGASTRTITVNDAWVMLHYSAAAQTQIYPDDASHALASDVAGSSTSYSFSPADASHAHAADGATSSTSYAFSPADASHAQAADNATFDTSLAVTPHDATHQLVDGSAFARRSEGGDNGITFSADGRTISGSAGSNLWEVPVLGGAAAANSPMYFEVEVVDTDTTTTTSSAVGFYKLGTATDSLGGVLNQSLGWYADGRMLYQTAVYPQEFGFQNGDVLMVAINNQNVWFGKNGTWIHNGSGRGNPGAGTFPTAVISGPNANYWPALDVRGDFNFVLRSKPAEFSYPVPSGFASLGGGDFTQNHVIAIADASHAHAAENATVDAQAIIIPADASHAHAADLVTLRMLIWKFRNSHGGFEGATYNDNFAADFTGWHNHALVPGTSTNTRETTTKHSGTAALRSFGDYQASPVTKASVFRQVVPSLNEQGAAENDLFVMEAWFYLPSSNASINELFLMDIENVESSGGIRLKSQFTGGANRIRMDRGELGLPNTGVSSVAVPTNTWFKLEWKVLVHPSAGRSQVFMDGVLVIDDQNIQTVITPDIAVLQNGYVWDTFEIGITANSTGSDVILYTDDVAFEHYGVAATIIVPAAASHALASDQATSSTSYTFSPADTSHAHAADAAGWSVVYTFSPADASHALASDQATWAQVHILTAQDASHALASDEATTATSYTFSPADATQQQTADQATTATTYTFAPADASHGHAADGATLTQVHIIPIGDASHALASDVATIAQVHSLTPADASHALASEQASFSQVHVVSPANASQQQTAENVTFVTAGQLDVHNASHALTSEQATSSTTYTFAVQDAAHALTSDVATFLHIHILVPADAVHQITSDEATYWAPTNTVFSVDDAVHQITSTEVWLGADVEVYPADAAHALTSSVATFFSYEPYYPGALVLAAEPSATLALDAEALQSLILAAEPAAVLAAGETGSATLELPAEAAATLALAEE